MLQMLTGRGMLPTHKINGFVEITEENGCARDANGMFVPNDDDTAITEAWVERRLNAALMLSTADNKRHGAWSPQKLP